MTQVKLYAQDWMFTMGLVGLKRVLKEQITVTQFGLTFDIQVLYDLADLFFEHMIAEYDIAERDYDRMQESLAYASKDMKTFKKTVGDVKRKVDEQSKKVVKYFADSSEIYQLNIISDQLTSLENTTQLEQLHMAIEEYYTVMKTKVINDKLTTNFFKAQIMTPFFGQPSFLNVSKSTLSLEEQIQLFHKDYIEPVVIEHHLKELLEQKGTIDKLKSFLEDRQSHPPFKQLFRKIKKLSSWDSVNNAFAALPKCSLVDGQLATTNFEEMVFSPLGVSTKNAVNFGWDLNSKHPIPLSALAKLVLFMAPAGVISYYRKDGFGEQRLYTGFVLSSDAFPEILRMNDNYRNLKQGKNSFDTIVYALLQDAEQGADYRVGQLFFIELYADYRSKKTLLDYYHMPAYVAKYFQRYGKNLEKIYIREYREAFVRSALRGIEPKEELYAYTRAIITQGSSGLSVYLAARELSRIQALKTGVVDLIDNDKRVKCVFYQGLQMRKKIIQAGKNREGINTRTFIASGGKKINAIAYRLLNSSKANNRQSFMDTVLRLYITTNERIPSIFMNVLHERDLKFEVIATAFIGGLLSGENPSIKEGG